MITSMKIRTSRLRRNDSTMLRVDNIRNVDIDDLEPYRASRNINGNPHTLYEQSGYEPKEKQKSGDKAITILGIVFVVVLCVIVYILLKKYVL